MPVASFEHDVRSDSLDGDTKCEGFWELLLPLCLDCIHTVADVSTDESYEGVYEEAEVVAVVNDDDDDDTEFDDDEDDEDDNGDGCDNDGDEDEDNDKGDGEHIQNVHALHEPVPDEFQEDPGAPEARALDAPEARSPDVPEAKVLNAQEARALAARCAYLESQLSTSRKLRIKEAREQEEDGLGPRPREWNKTRVERHRRKYLLKAFQSLPGIMAVCPRTGTASLPGQDPNAVREPRSPAAYQERRGWRANGGPALDFRARLHHPGFT